MNEALAAWSGSRAEHRLGERAGEGLPDDVRREFEEHVRGVFETGRQATFEGWVGDRAGRGGRYAVAICYPVQRNGEVSEAGILVLDATARRLAEEESAARARQQEVIARLAQAATTRTAAAALAAVACGEVTTMLEVDCTSALRVTDSGAVEVLAGAGDLSDLVAPAIARAGRGPGTMVAAALGAHGAIGASDVRSEVRFEVPREVVGAGVSSCVLVGIRAERAGHGVLVANSCRPRAFTAADTVFLEAVAGVLASRLEREAAEQALQESEEHRRQVFGEMLRATEEERARIASELHDDTVQVLTATLLAIDRMSAALDRGDPERLAGSTRTARATLTAAVDRTRRLMFELRPPLLEAHGVEPAVRDLAEQAAEEVGWEVETEFAVGRYPVPIESLVYRTVQEAIANARKHAQAARVRVELREDGGVLRGVVADDGRGFDKSRAMDRRLMRLHLGLESMIERVQLAGGTIDVDTAPGHGTRISFSVPLDADAPLGAMAPARAPQRY
jgi:signal transduction histidine kinase